MSYFSEHPEAYDAIEAKAISGKLMRSYCSGGKTDEDEDMFREDLESLIGDLMCATHNDKEKKLFDALRDWAHEEIVAETNSYFDGLYCY